MSTSSSTRKQTSLRITPSPYLQLVLHAAKYPARQIIGVLTTAAASSPSVATGLLPLFHTTPLSPTFELVLTQLALYFHAHQLQPCGVYYASDSYDSPTNNQDGRVLSTSLAHSAITLAEKLHESYGASAGRIAVLDAGRLGSFGTFSSKQTDIALDAFESQHSGWMNTGNVQLISSASGSDSHESDSSAVEFVREQLRSLVRDDLQRGLSDFDDHLDDAKADWTNAEYLKQVLPTMASKK